MAGSIPAMKPERGVNPPLAELSFKRVANYSGVIF
jgi:hypothetical protein